MLGTAALLAACAASPATGVARALGTPGLQFIGRLSYSWYLWHWPSLVFAAALVPALSLPGRMGVVLLSLLIAWITYSWVERPIRESRYLAARSQLTLVGAYLDDNHVTASYSARLAPAFSDALERLVRPAAPAPR